MDYQDAKNIREQSFGSRMANKLTGGQGIGSSLRDTLSEGAKARMTGLKEKFDPMNIAKFMTGGSKLGAAVVGKLTGRSQKDMEYFTGKKSSNKVDKLESGNEMVDMLMKIYTLMKKTNEDDTKLREDENSFKEEKEMEKLRRHKELIEAITGQKYSGKASVISKGQNNSSSGAGGGGIFDQLNDFVKGKAKEVGEKALVKTTATKVGKDVIKRTAIKTLGKTIGKGALKSIPILGAAIGAGFAINRLIEGDVVGAGIEAASGLGSALTSIPLTITNAARDVYKEVYGDFPDPTDPQDQKNLAEIYDICKEVASQLLKDSATEAPKPGEMQYDEMGNATGYATPESTTPPTPTSATPTSSTPTPTSATPTSSTPTSSVSPAASTSTATPSSPPNSGQQLMQVQGENLNAKIQETLSKGETVVNNNAVSKLINRSSTKGPLPPVRNHEETFAKMIYESTRVV